MKSHDVLEELKAVEDFRLGRGSSQQYPIFIGKVPPSTDFKRIYLHEKVLPLGIHLPIEFNYSDRDSINRLWGAYCVRHEADHIVAIRKYYGGRVPPWAEFAVQHFTKYENPLLAHFIFNIVEDNRIDTSSKQELPGEKRFFEREMKPVILQQRPNISKIKQEIGVFLELLALKVNVGETRNPVPPKYKKILKQCVSIAREAEGKDLEASLESTEKIYQIFKGNFDISVKIPKLPPLSGRRHQDEISDALPGEYGESIPPEGQDAKKKKKSQEMDEFYEQKPNLPPDVESYGDKSEPEGSGKKIKDRLKDTLPWKKDKSKDTGKPKYDAVLGRPKISGEFDVNRRVKGIVGKYRGEIENVRNMMRRLEKEGYIEERVLVGNEVDISEYVQTELEYEATGVMSDRKIFKKKERREINPVSGILADTSSSTIDIINEIIATFIIMGEAIGYSKFPSALYAFRSIWTWGRDKGYKDLVLVVKDFNEIYTEQTRLRALSLKSDGGTKMIDAIQYMTERIRQIDGWPKTLTIISDGEPDNPRKVKELLEKVKEENIHPFVVIIGSEHKESAEQITDEYAFIERDEIQRLPEELFKVFRSQGIIR